MGQETGNRGQAGDLRIGVALETFLDWPLERVLSWLPGQQIAPYWAGMAEFAAAENPGLRVCLELHPGTCVFNVETFCRVAALGPAIAGNLDPSHFFWMGIDGCCASSPGRPAERAVVRQRRR